MTFSPRQEQRIVDSVVQEEARSRGTIPAPVVAQQGALKAFVRITSATLSSGTYPGKWVYPDDHTTDGGDARVKDANAVVLATGKYYDARLVGYDTGTGFPVYETDRDAADAITSLAVGTSGTIPNWSNVGPAYTLNIPNASVASGSRGLITDAAQTLAGRKSFVGNISVTSQVGRIANGSFDGSSMSLDSVNMSLDASAGVGLASSFQLYAVASFVFNAELPYGGAVLLNTGPSAGQNPAYAIVPGGSSLTGAVAGKWGTDAIGNIIKGGIVTTIGTTNQLSIGGSVGGGPSSGGILFSDGSGNLSQDTGITFDTAIDALTLGGYLVTKQTSAPSGIPTNSIAGPWVKTGT